MARLTLCLIARDEAMFLARCLASVRGVVDEIIVVDTGSKDETPEIARRAGAKVVHFPWIDDFSAARNFALTHATGSFVLVLDADEELAPSAGAALKKAIKRHDLDCGMLPLHNAKRLFGPVRSVLDGTERIGEPTLLPRLLRRLPDLKWNGLIHESVGPWVAARQTRVHAIKAPIVHWGAVAEIRELRGKSDRNMTLLRARCLAEPDSPNPRQYLAAELITAGRAAEAWPILDEGWRLLERAMAGPGPYPAFVRLVTLRVQQQLARGDLPGAFATLDATVGWGSRNPNLGYLRGRSHELAALRATGDARTSHLVAARQAFEEVLEKDGLTWPEDVLPEITNRIGHIRAGIVALQLRDGPGAMRHLEPLIADPIPEARLGAIEAMVLTGHAADALRRLERELGADAPDAWVLAAAAADRLGALDDFAAFVAEARARRAKHRPLAPHRDAMLTEQAAIVGLYRGERPAFGQGPLGALLAVCARGPLPVGTPATLALPAGFATLTQNLARAHRVDALETLFERRATALFPGILEAATRALAELGLNIEDDGEPAPIFVVGPGADAWVPALDAHEALVADGEATADDPGLRQRVLQHRDRPVHATNRADLDALLASFPRGRAVGAGLPLAHERGVTVACDPTDGDLQRALAFLGEPWDPALATGGAEVDDLLRSLLGLDLAVAS